MNLKLSLLAIFLFPAVGLCQSAIITAGGDGNGTGGSISFSIGQVSNSSAYSNGGNIQEGVQQPYELSPVEVDESMAAIQLSIFPNPTSGQLTIQQNSFSESLSISIFDSSGTLIHSSQTTSSATWLDTCSWAPGVYFIELTSENLLKSRYKLVKG